MYRWALVLGCALFSTVVAAQERAASTGEFPYVAYVKMARTSVRSGPGKVHYASNFLDAGQAIEVWRHDPGGWLAIRPPAGSVSWVDADQVETTNEPGIGRVRVDDATAWVGADDESAKKLLWQVRLDKGELVEVLGRLQSATTGKPRYKIAPPAGEFRWVHEQFVSTGRPDSLSDKPPDPVVQTSATEKKTSQPQPTQAEPPSPSAESTTSVAAPKAATMDFARRLRSTEVALSLVLSLPVEHWQFDEARIAATELVGHADTGLKRGQARVLLEKIEKFAALQTKLSLPISPTPAVTAATRQAENSRVESARRPLDLRSETDPRYDGFGWLVEVRTSRTGLPGYALVDDRGEVQFYVTPGPGRNLHRYLRKEVGIYGDQGYHRTLKSPHITAHRIVDLARHRR